MEISVIGTGYVGLVAGVCFADAGHKVHCVDRDENKIKQLNDGGVPIYEPGLEDILRTAKKRLTFSTDIKKAIEDTEVIFIAVGTPEKEDGSADMGPTQKVVESICQFANGPKKIVLKSTVPIGTAKYFKGFCKEHSQFEMTIINNPEFLKEGAAIDDFLKPDRVVIGTDSEDARESMRELYAPFVKNGNPILFMSNASAEMTKYAANAFLSVKISFVNELAKLADQVGADIDEVRKGFTSDNRINPAFFYPGVGYGGSCFPKDVKALVYTGKENQVPMSVVDAADQVNDLQKTLLFEKLLSHFGDIKGKTIGIWGLSFKPRTDDMREAPSIYIIEKLVQAGAKVKAYDPVAHETAPQAIPHNFELCDHPDQAIENSDALMLITEWNEFRSPDFDKMKRLLKEPNVFDGRNVYNPNKMKDMGFNYFCIGRQVLTQKENH